MIIKKDHPYFLEQLFCASCDKPAVIVFTNYANNYEDIALCKKCALQLSRKLLEDLCDLDGDRHG